MQATFLFQTNLGGSYNSSSLYLEDVSGTVHLTFTVTNVAGNSASVTTLLNTDSEEPSISLIGKTSSPRTEELRVESSVSFASDCNPDVAYV